MSEPLAAWRERGRTLDVFGQDVFVAEIGQGAATPIAILHGYPTSSYDWCEVVDRLAEDRRVVVFDFLGFGLSDKPRNYSYSLIEQAETAIEVWRRTGLQRLHLVAHDYGTSVATELLARRERDLLPVDLASVTLTNGSVHIELAHLTTSQRILRSTWAGPVLSRFASEGFFRARMRALWGDAARLSDEHLASMWEGLIRADGRQRLPAVTQYLRERTRYWHRWVEPLTRLDVPAHIVWGRRDPVAVVAIADRLAAEIPGATLSWLEALGHYPMLEDPEAFARAVLGFFGDS